MKRFYLILLLLTIAALSQAQRDTGFRKIGFIKGDIVDFSTDALDNIYVLTSKDQLKKYNAAGDSVGVFNNVTKFGKVSMMDASNPLKVLLYYKDFSTIVVLDRFLSIRNTIDLRKQNIFQVSVIAQSYDNNIWLYDEADSKLKKIDEQGKLMLETPEFRLLFDQAPLIREIFDQEGFVYLYDPQQSVFVFDYYGALKNKILISGWKDFKVAGKFIFGVNGDTLHRYEINSFRVGDEKFPSSFGDILKVDFTASRLYALRKGLLEIYSFR